MKMKRLLLVVLSLLLLLAFGCSKDTNNSSVTNPNPNTVYPVGYIQGIVKDSCTGNPIVGAVVDIGIAKATTNANGQYIMKNVPATTYLNDNRGSGWSGNYSATIDTSKAYAVNNDGTVVPNTNYARVYYDEVEVAFSSFNESEGEVETTSNHDTPITKLGNGDFDFYLGQLTASISGTVQLAANHAAAGSYIVALYSTSNGRTGNNATGFSGHRVKATATAADGTFSFTGIEAGQQFYVVAVDTATGMAKFIGYSQDVTSGCDGSNTNVGFIYVANVDDICPFIIAASPLDWSDISADAPNGIDITFTFSEPILATQYNTGRALLATTNFEDFHGLYEDIDVNYTGNKDSNIPHTLSWNADMTVLTIHIAQEFIAPAAVYEVEIDDTRYLTDAAGNELSNGPDATGEEAGIVPCEWDDWANDIHFTTFGAVAAGAVTDLAIRDADLIDFDSNVALTWTPVYGAKSYNLYCQVCQWPGELTTPCEDPLITGQCHPYFFVGNMDWAATVVYLDFDGRGSLMGPGFDDILRRFGGVDVLDWNDTDFVENGMIKLAYKCYVRGVDADGIEGPASNIVYIEDTVHPCMSASTSGTVSTFTVHFSEPMNKGAVQTIANWTLGTWTPAVTITGIDYFNIPGNWYAVFTLSAPATFGTGTITTGTIVTAGAAIADVSGNPPVPLTVVNGSVCLRILGNFINP